MVVTEPIASTTAGFVRGRRVDGAEEYLGIPFAIAERFAPPRPAPAWEGTRDALAAGPSAPQPGSVYVHGELPDADERGCLNLNVFTPSPDGARPVLVWLHGGGFSMGHGAAGLYRGDRLAVAADAVVVTVNYRLGSLGWLAHPDLAAGPGLPAANWGLLDQIQALRWVRDNIAEFGGDPARVTLAGQSAGALCAMDLMVSPAAAGLFSRVILHSPPLGDVAQEPERGRRWASALMARRAPRASWACTNWRPRSSSRRRSGCSPRRTGRAPAAGRSPRSIPRRFRPRPPPRRGPPRTLTS